jgi:beta-N-acetylhexosaminidase
MIGPIIADIEGIALSAEDQELLRHPLIGGVILFTRNYSEPEQLKSLIDSIKALKRPSPLLISVDHEGGRVQRFRPGFTKLPPMALIGKLYDNDPAKAIKAAFLVGWLLAAELRSYNIDYSYTPVLDLNYDVSAIIGDRAFHQDPQVVIILTKSLIDGLHSAGMAATGKHFPGHGAVQADSHVAIPVDDRDMTTIWQTDIVPYAALIKQNCLDSIMTAHVIYQQIDPDPPCFSSFWLQRVLRDELNFRGVIISDDLTMEGATVAGNYAARAELALHAGCDMLLICNKREAVIEALEHISQFYVPNLEMNQRCQKLYAKPLPNDFQQHSNWQAAVAVVNELNEQ